MEKDLQVVGFRIGNETYGVRISAVREIVRVPEITAVPSAPDIIEGVINLRGKIIPVMDLRKRFGQVYTVADKKNRILVVEIDNKLVGLIVNAGHGLNYHNVEPIAAIPEIIELNIGHAIVARSITDGLAKAVRDMKGLMRAARA